MSDWSIQSAPQRMIGGRYLQGHQPQRPQAQGEALGEKEDVSRAKIAEAQSAREKKLRRAVSEFEAMFIQQMFRSMRKTVPDAGENSLIKKGQGEKIFREMLDGEYAKLMSERPGSFGLKEALYQQLTQQRLSPAQPQNHHTTNAAQALEQLRQQKNELNGLNSVQGSGTTAAYPSVNKANREH
ncbi:rod-binding protein [Magnetococcales bacterium HHB-1]